MDELIYFDNHASTKIDERVLNSMLPYFSEFYANPSSGHSFATYAKAAIELSKKQLADYFAVDASNIEFTSSATESINLAILGYVKANSGNRKHIISSNMEHPAVTACLDYLEQNGFEITYLKATETGVIDLSSLVKALRKDTLLVSIAAVNGEIGTIQDINLFNSACKENGTVFHTDASQATGKIEKSFFKNNFSLLSFSGHKIHGPKGSGALIKSNEASGFKLAPLILGGNRISAISGTLNTPCIVGIGKALSLCDYEIERFKYTGELRNQLQSQLLELFPDGKVNGEIAKRVPVNLSFTFPSISTVEFLKKQKKIAVSSGSACSTGDGTPSKILINTGLNKEQALSTVRFGLSKFTTIQEIDTLIELLRSAKK
ncbi:MAG: cysteine desulfurase [Ignavibacteriaceae bacterium]|nr:cysteine desulfurase [Ignavibacteriaceae bacterium]